jgi:hypothetical protein
MNSLIAMYFQKNNNVTLEQWVNVYVNCFDAFTSIHIHKITIL